MSDPQDRAEQLDPSVLGENPGDDELPGINDHADRRQLHVEDPAVLLGGADAQDGPVLRDWREHSDGGPEGDEPAGLRLVETESDVPTLADDEPSAVADAEKTDEPSAEEAAIHIVDPDR